MSENGKGNQAGGNGPEADLRQRIILFLGQHKVMTISTCKEKKPWIASVFYAFDDKLNLYFVSGKATRHSQEMELNEYVAVAINAQYPDMGMVKGLQIEGKAKHLGALHLPAGISALRERFPSALGSLSLGELVERAATTHLFRVTPTRIYFLNENDFGQGVRRELIV